MNSSDMQEKLIGFLFETNAFKVADPSNPFWYTSGTIGPYYINTHFLFDGEEDANKFLDLINESKDKKMECPAILMERINEVYAKNGIFKETIDLLTQYISEKYDLDSFDYVSGGERRDWFFSLKIAQLLKKPHITIYKDLSMVLDDFESETKEIDTIDGKNVFHIADLLNIASSYIRAWIPAIKNLNGNLKYALNVVDRNQGGAEQVGNEGIEVDAAITFNAEFLDKSLATGYLSEAQHALLKEYVKDPQLCMKNFLVNNPDFLEKALHSEDPKTQERAKMCVDQDLYGLKAS